MFVAFYRLLKQKDRLVAGLFDTRLHGHALRFLSQQRQHHGGLLVGLRQHRRGGLLNDLSTRQFTGCVGVIGVSNLATRSTGVLRHVGSVVGCMCKPVDARTHH